MGSQLKNGCPLFLNIKKMKTIILLTCLLKLFTIEVKCQTQPDTLSYESKDASKVVKITLNDNSVLFGMIMDQNDSLIVFKTISGVQLAFNPIIIKETEFLKGDVHDGKYFRYDPSSSRLFFSSTARTPKAGSGYFSVYELLFPFISIAATDFFVINAGVSIVPGASDQLVFLSPKIRFYNSNSFCAAGGVLYINIPDDLDDAFLGYGVVTIGNQRSGLTVGYGTNLSNKSDNLSGLLILGGDVQISNSVKLISENYFPVGDADNEVIYSFGIRFFGENLSADLGLFGVTGESDGWPFLPWVGFSYNF